MEEFHQKSLRTLAQQRGLQIGVGIDNVSYLDDPRYRDLLSREFNMLTPGNAMKFSHLRPTYDSYNFTSADVLVSFAQAHNMSVRGHTLVWRRRLPHWLTKGRFTRNEVTNILRDHIFTVMRHFQGKVVAWDVVNEAVMDDGTFTPSFWRETIGDNYIEYAFHWAHEADPEVRLFYNEWDADGLNRKSDTVYALLQNLRKKGVPVHGMGFQMHTSLTDTEMIGQFPNLHEIEVNMRRFAQLGLELHVTEMDVQIAEASGTLDARLARQAQIYRDVLMLGLRLPQFKALVVWGLTDRHSWIPAFTGKPDAPVLFDEKYQPKLAYHACKGALVVYDKRNEQ